MLLKPLMLKPTVAALIATGMIAPAAAQTFSADFSGTGNQTLSVVVKPKTADVGATANIYIGAYKSPNWFFLVSQGNGKFTAQAWTGGAIPVYTSQTLANSNNLSLTVGDLTGLAGMDIYVGYGKSEAELLSAKTYGVLQTVAGDSIAVSKYTVDVPTSLYVPNGAVTAAAKAAWPNGFPTAFGSGLAFKSRGSDGSLTFYGITDRGPNGDSPNYKASATATASSSKVFTAPTFAPKYATLTLKDGAVSLSNVTELKTSAGVPISGRPITPGTTGASGEVPLDDALAPLTYDDNGMDPEGIAIDAAGNLWICDEYGPFIAKIEAATGKILNKYAPGAGLPSILQYRAPNRGMEGVAVTPSGKVYGAVQSTLEITNVTGKDTSKAQFTRIVELDPVSGATKMFAYPIDVSKYSKTRDAKIGDLYALSDTRFLLIEQGKQTDGIVHNMVYLIDLTGATDISSIKTSDSLELEFATTTADVTARGVTLVKKLKLFDMRANNSGWLPEKAEGLTVLDDGQTIAVANDNDFTMSASIVGNTTTDPTKFNVDAAKALTDSKGAAATGTYTLAPNSVDEQPSRLWLFKLPKKLSEYTVQ